MSLNPKQQKYGKGYFLIANPVLSDPNFSRTVVLLCNHDGQGSFGLVVNRVAEVNPAEVFADYDPLKFYRKKLYIGGPVSQTQVFYLCRSRTPLPSMEPVCGGVHLGLNWDTLPEVMAALENPEDNIRFYLGYSGWGAGQLTGEMEQHSWLTCAAQDHFVFNEQEDHIWPEVVRSLGDDYRYLLNAPVNPQWN